uniref:Rna binding protein n=1 Tax=Tetraselmis sp. GSL018 TaxID=582737 RepID=A0A061R087_9CHLO|mmetsp:Transcript_885/g.2122  ORF Transcript_885/g.2122 Transcript_885/m.2122 type:complete len:378 (+) Transcript_885:121-1254(+)|eukprot:CAMPEP_0177609826 /NCGR_PEP_ID=MMETSP0419_2-20121207/19362_1 /TAXON_ID=582737 /ORGANISM="Tetraselmis sp., Strain GSL018" /LENGTH=377 /DNA_ID=CAMNT_0019104909 /DNA_START=76 /DNA_END=1209 /DNA_ORIENTATION=+
MAYTAPLTCNSALSGVSRFPSPRPKPGAIPSPGAKSCRGTRSTHYSTGSTFRLDTPGFSNLRYSRCRTCASQGQPTVSDASGLQQNGIPKGEVWELDFCSRPLVDDKGKKVWELLICNPERTFEYTEYFPNNRVNSAELKRAISRVLEVEGAERPRKVRYFRGQMQTIISRALNDLDVKIVPSRRCFTLISWLEERLATVYSKDSRYSADSQPGFTLDLGSPADLPDALRGEKWAFVEFPLGALMEEAKAVENGDAFGSCFSLESVGCSDLSPETLIPGVAVFSRRAAPLAAWTNSLELASITADKDRACLILETGVSNRWRYASYLRSPESTAECEAWEAAKQSRRGLHFLAVQSDPEAEQCDGFWMLQEREPPKI